MITDLEKYRKKKQIQNQKGQMTKIPIYTQIYKEGNKVFGKSPKGRKIIIKED